MFNNRHQMLRNTKLARPEQVISCLSVTVKWSSWHRKRQKEARYSVCNANQAHGTISCSSRVTTAFSPTSASKATRRISDSSRGKDGSTNLGREEFHGESRPVSRTGQHRAHAHAFAR